MSLDISGTLVVAALTDSLREKTRDAERMGADAVEVRIDMYDGGADEALGALTPDLELPVIATDRPTDDETEDERAEKLVRAARRDAVEAVDVDVSSPAETVDRVAEAARENDTSLIASHHDFEKTPSYDDMRRTVEEAWAMGDVAKLAVTPETRRDTHRLLGLTLDAAEEGGGTVATMAMGSLGTHTRVVAPLYGSCLTYGSHGEPTADGQISVERLVDALETLGAR